MPTNLFFMKILSFQPQTQSNNLIKILIPSENWASLFLLLILVHSLSFFCTAIDPIETTSTSSAMKVHPMPKKRNITIQFDVGSRNPVSEAQAFLGFKKLRRLPHVFNRVLELPFRSDADVSIEENAECFRFVAETDGIGDGVRAHTVEIHPGVTKIVVRESEYVELSLDELELDMWRFRLPDSTRPDLASAVFVDGELIVTVPKDDGVEDCEHRGGGGETWGRLVLVQ